MTYGGSALGLLLLCPPLDLYDILLDLVNLSMHVYEFCFQAQRTVYGAVQMTGTTDIEEELLGAGGMVPFSIEAKLRKYGAYFRQGTSDTRPFATRSGSIVTGQNCASTLLTAEGLVEAMSLGVRMTIA